MQATFELYRKLTGLIEASAATVLRALPGYPDIRSRRAVWAAFLW